MLLITDFSVYLNIPPAAGQGYCNGINTGIKVTLFYQNLTKSLPKVNRIFYIDMEYHFYAYKRTNVNLLS